MHIALSVHPCITAWNTAAGHLQHTDERSADKLDNHTSTMILILCDSWYSSNVCRRDETWRFHVPIKKLHFTCRIWRLVDHLQPTLKRSAHKLCSHTSTMILHVWGTWYPRTFAGVMKRVMYTFRWKKRTLQVPYLAYADNRLVFDYRAYWNIRHVLFDHLSFSFLIYPSLCALPEYGHRKRNAKACTDFVFENVYLLCLAPPIPFFSINDKRFGFLPIWPLGSAIWAFPRMK